MRRVIRGVFRTQSNIFDGAFLLLAVNYFRQNTPSHMFDLVVNIPLIMANRSSWNSKIVIMNDCLRYHLTVLEKRLCKASCLEKVRVSTSYLLRFHSKMNCFTESFQGLALNIRTRSFRIAFNYSSSPLTHSFLAYLNIKKISCKSHTYS